MQSTDLECPLCEEEYRPAAKEPVLCPSCGYTLCTPCAIGVSTTTKKCPICACSAGANGAVWGASLPRNRKLMELLEVVRAAGKHVKEVRLADLQLNEEGTPHAQGGCASVFTGVYRSGGKATDIVFKWFPHIHGNLPPAQREKMVKQVEREARLLAYVAHPGVVKCFGYVKDDAKHKYGLVLERANGGAYLDRLETALQQTGSGADVYNALRQDLSSVMQLLQLLQDACGALQYMEMQKIVHRDVKPPNLLVFNSSSGDATVKLCDFGSARMTEVPANVAGSSSSMQPGTLVSLQFALGVGTPHYRAPELVDNTKDDKKADVFSFGVLLWWVMEGRWTEHGKAFLAKSPQLMMVDYCRGLRPKLLDEKDLSIPDKALRQLVERCWTQEASGRPDFSAVSSALKAVIRDFILHPPRQPKPASLFCPEKSETGFSVSDGGRKATLGKHNYQTIAVVKANVSLAEKYTWKLRVTDPARDGDMFFGFFNGDGRIPEVHLSKAAVFSSAGVYEHAGQKLQLDRGIADGDTLEIRLDASNRCCPVLRVPTHSSSSFFLPAVWNGVRFFVAASYAEQCVEFVD